jgi:hypothetical protein
MMPSCNSEKPKFREPILDRFSSYTTAPAAELMMCLPVEAFLPIDFK